MASDPSAASPGRTSLRRLLTVLLVAVPLAAAPPAAADFKDAYTEGLEAARAGDWSRSAELMRRALAEEPTPQSRVRLYGMRFIPYVPHHHLGVALWRSGDCFGAMAAWDRAEAAGVVAELGEELEVLQEGRQACRARLRQEAVAREEPAPEPAAPAGAEKAAAPAPPPSLLRAAVGTYLRGDYRGTVARLEGVTFEEPRAQSQALLFRAAARYALYLRGGGEDRRLRELVTRDLRDARRLVPELQPDGAVFSPPFVELVRRGG